MEVILLEKIGKLGNIGDVANVKSGYGRNYSYLRVRHCLQLKLISKSLKLVVLI